MTKLSLVIILCLLRALSPSPGLWRKCWGIGSTMQTQRYYHSDKWVMWVVCLRRRTWSGVHLESQKRMEWFLFLTHFIRPSSGWLSQTQSEEEGGVGGVKLFDSREILKNLKFFFSFIVAIWWAYMKSIQYSVFSTSLFGIKHQIV